MARDLATLKNALWEQFEIAVKKQSEYADYAGGGNYNCYAVANRQAIAQLAQSIVAVEEAQRLREEAAGKRTEKTFVDPSL